MSEEEQNCRIQHLLNVLETAAIHSSPTEFQSHGWTVARDYDYRVMADMDRGIINWINLGPSIHAGNYTQAVSANPTPLSGAKMLGGKRGKKEPRRIFAPLLTLALKPGNVTGK